MLDRIVASSVGFVVGMSVIDLEIGTLAVDHEVLLIGRDVGWVCAVGQIDYGVRPHLTERTIGVGTRNDWDVDGLTVGHVHILQADAMGKDLAVEVMQTRTGGKGETF